MNDYNRCEISTKMKQKIQALRQKISGDVFDSSLYKTIYATDASVYKEEPLLVVLPKNNTDIQTVIEFARTEKIPIIPRGAGTSLCGQVVGKGLILDISKYMNSILNLDVENKQVTVQPGVVLDELNKYLEKYGLFFGPETSTANRCMIGGMVGIQLFTAVPATMFIPLRFFYPTERKLFLHPSLPTN